MASFEIICHRFSDIIEVILYAIIYKHKKKCIMRKLLLVFSVACFAFSAQAKTWDFTVWSAETLANFTADAANWSVYDGVGDTARYYNVAAVSAAEFVANSVAVAETKGLLFTGAAEKFRLGRRRLQMNGSSLIMTIPSCKAGSKVEVTFNSANSSSVRDYSISNATGAVTGTDLPIITNTHTVTADGDVSITTNGGLLFYSIKAETTVDAAQLLNEHKVVKTEYFSISGVSAGDNISILSKGIYIKRELLDNGKFRVEKFIKLDR